MLATKGLHSAPKYLSLLTADLSVVFGDGGKRGKRQGSCGGAAAWRQQLNVYLFNRSPISFTIECQTIFSFHRLQHTYPLLQPFLLLFSIVTPSYYISPNPTKRAYLFLQPSWNLPAFSLLRWVYLPLLWSEFPFRTVFSTARAGVFASTVVRLKHTATARAINAPNAVKRKSSAIDAAASAVNPDPRTVPRVAKQPNMNWLFIWFFFSLSAFFLSMVSSTFLLSPNEKNRLGNAFAWTRLQSIQLIHPRNRNSTQCNATQRNKTECKTWICDSNRSKTFIRFLIMMMDRDGFFFPLFVYMYCWNGGLFMDRNRGTGKHPFGYIDTLFWIHRHIFWIYKHPPKI